ncbi:L-threonylcarbamoyladenylate synthase [Prochlorococcus sp. MIT 1341]|uniref:L-threonylcarbamoyladenylate synthase n=1 Tax=Prochlorococcus sp. MIT 1341 TaxID=3096221 RepID=UPI002A7638CE|nr:L-threonylcarbamoyladenylate synthase [Prochlorococcus sp. MIT 1341]
MQPSCVLDQKSLALKIAEGVPALLPTDTLPALAVSPNKASKLWEIKRRPLDKPLILMGATPQDLFEYVYECALNDALKMAEIYWPGPLTLVLPASGEIVEALNPGSLSIGLRVPACLLTTSLLARTGPLATTSANLAGNKPTKNSEEASAVFPDLPLLGPIPWPSSSGLASTVLKWEQDSSWKVLRRGQVNPDLSKKE